MFGLHEIFNKKLQRELEPTEFLLKIIKSRLLDFGVRLNRSQLKTLRCQLRASEPSISLELTDSQVARAKIKSKPELEGAIVSALSDVSSDALDKAGKIESALPSIMHDMAEYAGELIFKGLRRSYWHQLKERREIQANFEESLYLVWGKAISQLEVLLGLVSEAVGYIEETLCTNENSYSEVKWEVLSRLHARACQITQEVILLLKGGYADGAQARWRSLHEISVVGSFICDHEDDIAERYLLHDTIEEYKETLHLLSRSSELNDDTEFCSYFHKLEAEKESLVREYGKNFVDDYGWATGTLGGHRPSFRQLEKMVDLPYLRPAYREASHNVHAGVRGTLFRLGLHPDCEMILEGASDYGLATPGHLTAVSLLEATIKLLQGVELIDSAVVMNVISRQVDITRKEFWRAHRYMVKALAQPDDAPEGDPEVAFERAST